MINAGILWVRTGAESAVIALGGQSTGRRVCIRRTMPVMAKDSKEAEDPMKAATVWTRMRIRMRVTMRVAARGVAARGVAARGVAAGVTGDMASRMTGRMPSRVTAGMSATETARVSPARMSPAVLGTTSINANRKSRDQKQGKRQSRPCRH
jgi:hypothetical protein